MTAETATYCLWGVWAASWVAAALWADRTVARPGWGAEAAYRAVTAIGFLLLFFFASANAAPRWRMRSVARLGPLAEPLWRIAPPWGWALFVAAAVGFAVCWWARLHLGRLWSGAVTRKAGHRIVDTGPYRLVRHPIYTGLLLASAAMAVLKGTPVAALGLVVVWIGFWMKARLEERFLRSELGAQAYDAFSLRTPMLVPFWPR